MRTATVYILILQLTLGPSAFSITQKAKEKISSKKVTTKKISEPKPGRYNNIVKDPRRKLSDRLLDWVRIFGANENGEREENAEEEESGEEENSQDSSNLSKSQNKNKNQSGFGTGSVTMNENAPRQKPIDPGKKKDNDDDGDGAGPSDQTPPLVGQDIDWFYPMCLFVDPAYDANAAIKKLVDDAASQCGVLVKVKAVTVKANYPPESSDAINALQTANCNADQYWGVAAASTSFCSRGIQVAGEMCKVPLLNAQGVQIGWDPAVGGCAQMNQAGGGGYTQKQQDQIKGMTAKMSQASGSVVPSIERAGSCDGDTIGHEAQGHSQMGVPNGSTHGKGIGWPMPGESEGTEGSGGGGWTTTGCIAMRANSFENVRNLKWFPEQTKYYKHQTDPARQWDLYAGKKVYGNAVASSGSSGGGMPPMVPPKDPIQKKLQAKGVNPEPPAKAKDPDPGDPHKKKKIAEAKADPKLEKIKAQLKAAAEGNLSLVKNEEDLPEVKLAPKLPPPPRGAPPSVSYGYDENRKYGDQAISPTELSPTGIANTEQAGGASVTYNEKAKKGQAGIAVGDGVKDGKPNGRDTASISEDGTAGKDGMTDGDDNFFKKKKKKLPKDWRRKAGSTLRSGGATLRGGAGATGLYQSGPTE
jgi:hypothetical protein